MLVQRQWIEFGHKFADRCGVLNSDDNEKSPVFLQFLDCVYQLWMKNQSQFQFNRKYLVHLSGVWEFLLSPSISDETRSAHILRTFRHFHIQFVKRSGWTWWSIHWHSRTREETTALFPSLAVSGSRKPRVGVFRHRGVTEKIFGGKGVAGNFFLSFNKFS